VKTTLQFRIPLTFPNFNYLLKINNLLTLKMTKRRISLLTMVIIKIIINMTEEESFMDITAMEDKIVETETMMEISKEDLVTDLWYSKSNSINSINLTTYSMTNSGITWMHRFKTLNLNLKKFHSHQAPNILLSSPITPISMARRQASPLTWKI